ncbi:MAG: SDR family oxidoreductase [Candidatus Altiarchaeota archaeon]|nr:SDR family oxidoreductase [Candidatus Altiarchaeota archaeon]
MELKHKVVLITGSSVGIGAEAAKLFSSEGSQVILTYKKNKSEGEKLASEINAKLIQLDVSNKESIDALVKTVISEFNHIDILVNNAGVLTWKKLLDQSDEELKDQVLTNLLGLIRVTKAVLPHLKGMIINIASGAGKTGFGGLSPYCATKFGVRGFTQSMAKEIDLPLYCVNPGMTATRMTNYKGIEPKKVGQVILNTAKETLSKKSGDDVDVWDYY